MKLTGAGQIIIPETLAKGTEPVEYFPENWGKILLTDAAGINYTLYAVKGEVDLNQYELPPAPTAGMFDIRYQQWKDSRRPEQCNKDNRDERSNISIDSKSRRNGYQIDG